MRSGYSVVNKVFAMSYCLFLRAGEIFAAVLLEKSVVDLVRIVQDELLDGGVPSRAGIPKLVESLKEGEPGKDIALCRG